MNVKNKRIWFLGDSITEGVASLCMYEVKFLCAIRQTI